MAIRYFILTKTLLVSFLRDRQNLFLTLALPLVFLFIFGSLFQNEGQQERITRVAVFVPPETTSDKDLWHVLDSTTGLRLDIVESEATLEEWVSGFKTDIGLIWDGSALRIYTNPTRMQDNSYFHQVASGIRSALEYQRTGLVRFIQVQNRQVGNQSLGGLDYLFPGIIALGVLSSGLFAISSSFMHYKDKKVLKRLMATSMSKVTFLAALMTTRMVASIMSTFMVLAAGIFVFRLTLTINWVLFLPYILVGTVTMMGLGALVTLIAKTAENAIQISTILMTIMMFFSGIYFPVEFLPSYFQRVSAFLPLSHVAKGIRYTMGIEAMDGVHFFLQAALLLVASSALTWFVTLKSRWND